MQPHSPSGQDSAAAGRFAFNRILTGDARVRLAQLPEASVDLSFWSPPYYVGKSYERHLSFDDWRELLRDVIRCHRRIVKPGGFLVVNIGDILCFPDPAMPKFQANNVVDELGQLEHTISRGGRKFDVVTIIAKYIYAEHHGSHNLERIIVACIPNGRLQQRYNPNAEDTIWLAGRNAPTRGEDFRVRLSFQRLRDKAHWRVRELPSDDTREA